MSDDITPQPAIFDEWWRSVFGNTRDAEVRQ